jgi:transposase
VLSVEDWAEIRRLHRAEGLPIKVIARLLGVSRNTVRSAIATDAAPKSVRRPARSIVDEVEPRIRELLQVYPPMPATVIAERIGWARGLTVLKERIAELRPVYLPPDPASRTSYAAGEIAQCDFWFPPVDVPVGFGQARHSTQLPVLTMVTGYSRWLSALLIPTRSAADLFAGWWQLIERLGSVPRVLVWDGEGAVGRWRAGKVELTAECQAFRGTLGAKVSGTGKTHLAIGLAIRACQAGHRVLFATAADWVSTLADTHHAGRLQAELVRLGRYPLLVIDEVGYIPFEPEAANLFFQLISSRYERASLIVTSNKQFGRWGEVFGDDVVAAAMIDRLVHHGEVIAFKGDSYRLKDRDLGRVPAGTTTED